MNVMGSLETQISENLVTPPTDLSACERRTKLRFPLKFDVLLRVRHPRRNIITASGHTLNISSSGMWIHTETPLREAMRIEISMSWPVLLDQTCPMKLVIYGSVIRTQDEHAAIAIERYEFRTQGRSRAPQLQMAAGADCSTSA